MKTYKLAGILAGLSLLSVSAFATGDILVVEEESPKKIEKIRVEIPQMFDLNMSIMDEEGRLIHSEVIESGEFAAKHYNLMQLNHGEYTITTQAAHQKVTKKIMLDNMGIEVLNKETEFDPIFIQDGSLLKVNFFNQEGSAVKLTLEDSQRIYLDKTYTDAVSFSEIIDTGNLFGGEYYLNLHIGDEQHTFYFNAM